jgi:uncharacterized DUF497 family protein
MEIEWDPAKASSNELKHGVEFEEAATCLLDPNAAVIESKSKRPRTGTDGCWSG